MRFLLGCFLACLPVLTLASVDIPAAKLATPPIIDGVIHSEEWTGVQPVTGGFDEVTGAPEVNTTEYWVAYDNDYIYFAARAHCQHPTDIRQQEFRTNVALQGDDYVGIAIDPFGTLRDTVNQFEINPRGATNLRIAGGRAAKREWLGEIAAKGRVTESGYEVEARIPWGIMRLPSAGMRDMRIDPYRVEPQISHAYLLTDNTGGHPERIPYWRGVQLPNIKPKRVLRLLPYTYLGYDKQEGGVFNSGLDLKTTTPSGLDLVGSINPDFRNIENSVLSLDFSYFERLANETRPFFLEGNRYFQTSQDIPLFASQRIGGFDAGFKTYGQLTDDTTVAALDTISFSRANNFVGIVRKSFDVNTSFTAAVTHQSLTDDPTLHDNQNLASFLSFDKSWGALEMFSQYMGSSDTSVGSGHRFNPGISYNGSGLSGFAEYQEVSPNFDPRLGFAPETGYKGIDGGMFLTRQYRKGAVLDNEIDIFGQDYNEFSGGAQYRRQVNVSDSIGFRSNLAASISAFYQEFLGYTDHLYSINLLKPRNNPYRSWSFNVQSGNLAGHSYTSVMPSLNLRPMHNWQISGSYQAVSHYTNDSQLILSSTYDINAFDSLAGRLIQHGGDVNGYVAYRRAGNKGNEYYLILGDPNADRFRFSLIAKAVFPLNLRF